MKSAFILKPLTGALVLAGAIATLSGALAGAAQNPVCTPAREVSSVLGRGAPAAAQVQCPVERKVRPTTEGIQVSAVLGRAGAAPRQSEQAASVVSVRITGSKAVETVLGRAGGATHNATGIVADTVASPTQ